MIEYFSDPGNWLILTACGVAGYLAGRYLF